MHLCRLSIFGFAILCSMAVPRLSEAKITKADYFNALQAIEEKGWQAFDKAYQAWIASDSAASLKPAEPLWAWGGKIDAFLYSVTGDPKYAQRAKTLLQFCSAGDGTVYAIRQIEKSGLLSPQDLKQIEQKLVKAADWAVNYWTEWGAMNHSTNHVINFLTAVMSYLPKHAEYPRWQQKRDINVSSSWGLWCIEDAEVYVSIWFKPLMEYAEMEGREKEFYAMPMTKYYFDYFVQLLAPNGGVVEFGDGGWSNYMNFVSCLEKGAAVYRNGKMKWAAHQIFASTFNNIEDSRHWSASDWVDAYRWADDSIEEEIPTDGSRLVLEDYVSKKVVFRSGWDSKATYMMLNFLEDAPFGVDGKEHIINTINVETEKNHHGHADENAICTMMKDSCMLLCDGGYRETSSTGPDGEFRADTYHNKLVVRDGIADDQMRLLPFLLDGGRYRFVKTKLMHFRRFKDVDISRTRLTDEERGYQWDRVISYLKGEEWFVLFDIVKVLKPGAYTFANLFYSTDIVDNDSQDHRWVDTRYTTVGYYKIPNPDNTRLLMYFPEARKFRSGAEQIRREYQTEWAIYNAKADSFKKDDMLVFTTFLIPHAKDQDVKSIASTLGNSEVYQGARGHGIKFQTTQGFKQLNVMLDLEAEYLKENIRPRYNFESGRAEYGRLTTDARYCYLRFGKNEVSYAFHSATKLLLDGKSIFAADGEYFGQDDGSYRRWGVAKTVAWEGTAPMPAGKK